MAQIQLTPRLACVAGKVRPKVRLADIGTDHAYLPAYLAQAQRISTAIAADLRQGPLERAEETIRQYQVGSRVETRLSDGLSQIEAEEADDIVIAGMGGELIVTILGACPWIQDPAKHFIFQPMTHSETLRRYLTEHDFSISSETAVTEGGKVYVVMDAYYTGTQHTYTPAFFYIGKLTDFSHGASRLFLEQQIRYLSNKLCGGEDPELRSILEELKRLYDNC